jgi:hypothetical protein
MTKAAGMIIPDISSRPCAQAQRSSYPTSFRASDLEDALSDAEKQKRVFLTFGRNSASLPWGRNTKGMVDNHTLGEAKMKDNVTRHGGSDSTAEGQKLPALDNHVKRTTSSATKVAILHANDEARRSTSVLREREHFLKDDDDHKKWVPRVLLSTILCPLPVEFVLMRCVCAVEIPTFGSVFHQKVVRKSTLSTKQSRSLEKDGWDPRSMEILGMTDNETINSITRHLAYHGFQF